MRPELSIYRRINARGTNLIEEIGADLSVRFETPTGSVLGLPNFGVDLDFAGSPASVNYITKLRTEPIRAAQDYNDGLRDSILDRRAVISDNPDEILIDIDQLDQGIALMRFKATAIADTSAEITINAAGNGI